VSDELCQYIDHIIMLKLMSSNNVCTGLITNYQFKVGLSALMISDSVCLYRSNVEIVAQIKHLG
jgi:hypothetical protein